MTKAQTLKSIIKKDPKPGFGSDPNDPWSTRGNISETVLLDRYLKSRGINPKYATKDLKVAHSKTNAFKNWLQAHARDNIGEGMTTSHTPTAKRAHAIKKSSHYGTEIRVPDGHKKLHSEAVDKKDTVTMDIPFLIRVLELARENLKTDIQLHNVVEKLIDLRKKGTLTMKDYKFITTIREEYAELIEDVKTHYYAPSQMQTVKKKKKKIKEDTYQDTLAATQMPFDTGNNPAEEPTTNNSKKTSTAVKIIKDIRKSKMVKEDLYDHEKEDKSVAGYGKQPKMAKTDKAVAIGAGKPQAAAVLSGGTTLTGQKRDTVEIDPALRVRPGQTGMEKPQKDKY